LFYDDRRRKNSASGGILWPELGGSEPASEMRKSKKGEIPQRAVLQEKDFPVLRPEYNQVCDRKESIEEMRADRRRPEERREVAEVKKSLPNPPAKFFTTPLTGESHGAGGCALGQLVGRHSCWSEKKIEQTLMGGAFYKRGGKSIN